MKQGDLFGGGAPAPKPASEPQAPAPAPPARPVVAPAPAPPAAAAPAAARPPEPPRAAPAPNKAPQVKAGPRVLSVSELTKQIKETLEPSFSRVLVRGEISGFKGPNTRGHLYFALKDAWAQVDARVWATTAAKLKFGLKDGLEVIAEGNLDLYPPSGRYALIVQKLEPAGLGAQALAFEQLKQKLLAEGLFGDKRKKPKLKVPVLPRRIGVVTSITGAALRDFVKVLYRRHPRLSILVANARVQGDGAAIEIEGGIRRLARTDVDVIVVTRGGGSAEDLWAFNEERVVRAIYDSPVPVISAVGHEVDVTLADFVADHRAATPSHAAEALAPVLADLELNLARQRQRLHKAVERSMVGQRAVLDRFARKLGDPRRGLSQHQLKLSELSDRMVSALRRGHQRRTAALKELERRIGRARPQARLQAVRERLAQASLRLHRAGNAMIRGQRAHLHELKVQLQSHAPRPKLHAERLRLRGEVERLAKLFKTKFARQHDRLHALERRLEALSPLKVLARGYSITRLQDGHVVTDVAQAPPGTRVRVLLNDEQELDAVVEGVRGSRQKG
ncbi:MAG: exodeoxyribonuclease VII large subunit [Archangiaceae bacterium]|nr:exodeoxyribonuclease VII large subunit [Archangiaceae bacterium]